MKISTKYYTSLYVALLCIFICLVETAAQTPTYFDFNQEHKKYLSYYDFANIFDSSAVTYTFGEVVMTKGDSTHRIFLAAILTSGQKIHASNIQGENIDLRTVARTENFTLQDGGSLTWFVRVTSFRNPCNEESPDGGSPDKPTLAWVLLDQTEFVTELVRVSDNTRIAVLDSVGVMPPALSGVPVDTRYGTNPQNVHKQYIAPTSLDNVQVYIRISPRRYGPTPLGIQVEKITNWVNFSAYYDSTGTAFIPATAYDALGKAYYQEFFAYCDSIKSATGWLPDISNVGFNDSLTAIFQAQYLESQIDTVAGRTYWVEKTAPRPKSGDLLLEDVLVQTDGLSPRTRITTQQKPEIIAASPNPGKSGQITVKIRAYTAPNVVIRLISIDGKPLGTLWTGTLTKGVDDYTLDASSLTPGVYFLSLEDNDGSRFHNIKIVVQ